jgi:flagellar hook-basal body complex protein FliE
MSSPIVPEQPTTQMNQLARALERRKARQEVMTSLTDIHAHIQEPLMRLVLTDDSVKETTRLQIMEALERSVNEQFEWLFPSEIEEIRKFLERLNRLGFDVHEQMHEMTELKNRLDSLILKLQTAKAKPMRSVKERRDVIWPIVKDSNKAKDDLMALSRKVRDKALEALRVLCRTVDPEAADRLFDSLTGDL